MKSRRITGTLLALMAGAFLAASCTNYGEDIEDINNRLDALTTSDVASPLGPRSRRPVKREDNPSSPPRQSKLSRIQGSNEGYGKERRPDLGGP